jgi:hypothetical protein
LKEYVNDDEDDPDTAKGMKNRSATSQNTGEQESKGFIDQIRKGSAGYTNHDRPTVIRYMPESETEKCACEDVGKNEHPGTR